MGRTKQTTRRRSDAVWAVSLTTFVDDYKLRGRSPSSLYGPYLFRKKDDAYSMLVALVRKHLTDHFWDEDDPNLEALPEQEVIDILLEDHEKEEYNECYRQRKEGEFVPECFDWDIEELEIH